MVLGLLRRDLWREDIHQPAVLVDEPPLAGHQVVGAGQVEAPGLALAVAEAGKARTEGFAHPQLTAALLAQKLDGRSHGASLPARASAKSAPRQR